MHPQAKRLQVGGSKGNVFVKRYVIEESTRQSFANLMRKIKQPSQNHGQLCWRFLSDLMFQTTAWGIKTIAVVQAQALSLIMTIAVPIASLVDAKNLQVAQAGFAQATISHKLRPQTPISTRSMPTAA